MENNFLIDHLAAGSLAQIQVPQQIPEPYDEFHPNWVDFAERNHGNVIKIVKAAPMAHAPDGMLSEVWLDGWSITNPGYLQKNAYYPQKGECAFWLPSEWLVPIASDFPCDCDTQQLMKQGCKISWHQ